MAPSMPQSQRAFTLLEVMVAMAIFALAAIALLNAGREQVNNSSHLEEKTLAHFVAMNAIAEQQLAKTLPEVGHGNSTVNLGGRDWLVETTIDNTPIQNTRRLTVDVSQASGDALGKKGPVLESLTAFVGQGGSNATSTSH